MPEPMSTSSRDQLLQAAVEHFAEHGIGNHSLRAIAAAIGTSHRMLIYHFGSREGLLVQVREAVEAGQRETLATLTADAGTDPREIITTFWATVAAAAHRYGPLFFELSAHAMQGRPHADRLRHTVVDPWLDPIADVFTRAGVDRPTALARARLSLGVARGLLHDALITGDMAGADAAMAAFTEMALPPREEHPSSAPARDLAP
ncbi:MULTISPECIES: TetR/AcrR family transcriptional regulator [Pseudonocardia]|uniref:AcrR family transcriptional regulator n=1 Tax=Pseudonocardia alni TaxID=33907 RepID=A0A852W8M2_PSEA5|nr:MULTISPECIES: TetR/AcrR family transcriptional regulator [Pseudonocardia]MCO7193143.1 TetR/AcrR family transcriptional regulator [Pseudonocardia sp. McavD-2-B]NYG05428.1 AcrR family transcriptional regulator [Pseudonocardia antarctica]